jgi:hypothetical protein
MYLTKWQLVKIPFVRDVRKKLKFRPWENQCSHLLKWSQKEFYEVNLISWTLDKTCLDNLAIELPTTMTHYSLSKKIINNYKRTLMY